MYDTLADEEEFREADAMIGQFAATLDQSRPYTTREFLNLLGKELSGRAEEDGIVTAAYKAGIPLYCPAVGDSSRSEEHTSELQSPYDLVCRLLLEKKNSI